MFLFKLKTICHIRNKLTNVSSIIATLSNITYSYRKRIHHTKMSGELDDYYDTVLELTKQAGKLVRERLTNNKQIEEKDADIDLVTETDKEVEELLIKSLAKKYPSHKFIGEETAATGKKQELTADPTWIIDPVDGTMNFVHGFPHCCICIGLYVNFEPEIGVIYNPALEQLFTARKNQGAYLNGKQIKVSGQTELNKALLMLESGTSRDEEKMKTYKENHNKLVGLIHGIRTLGSAGLDMAMVALGCADAYYEFGPHAWDFAAGTLIIREAGGVVIDPNGGPFDILSRRCLAASSQELADAFVKELVQFYPKPRDDE